MKRDIRIEGTVLALLVGLCVAMRLMPHAANFAPVAATALFAGFWFSRRYLAVLCPLAAMAASDTIIGGYNWRIMAVVYAAMAFPVVWRTVLRSKLSVPRVGLCALSGSLVFFLATNLAVWGGGTLYPRTLAGLGQCYAAALPFLRNTASADVIWSAALFGGYVLIRVFRARLAGAPAAATLPTS